MAVTVPSATRGGLPAGGAGDLERVTDDVRGLFMNEGTPGWVSVQGEVINVKQFGAVGDGAADDTVPIQNALNAVRNLLGTGTYKAGSVYFPAGVYRITDTLVPRGETLMFGAGKTGSVIRLQSSVADRVAIKASSITEVVPGTVRILKLGRIHLHNLWIQVNSEPDPQHPGEFIPRGQVALDIVGLDEGTYFSCSFSSLAVRSGVGVRIRPYEEAGVTEGPKQVGAYSGSFVGCNFNLFQRGLQMGALRTIVDQEVNSGANHWTFEACAFQSNHTGVFGIFAVGISFLGCRFDNNTAYGVDTDAVAEHFASLQYWLIQGGMFENNSVLHLNISAKCHDWTVSTLFTANSAGGQAADAGDRTLWLGTCAPSATPAPPRYWVDVPGYGTYHRGLMAVPGVGGSNLKQFEGGCQLMEGAATELLFFSIPTVNDDVWTAAVDYMVRSSSGAACSCLTGRVLFAYARNSSGAIAVSTNVIGETKALHGTLGVTFTTTTSDPVILRATLNTGGAGDGIIHFTAEVRGGQRTTSAVAFAAGVMTPRVPA